MLRITKKKEPVITKKTGKGSMKILNGEENLDTLWQIFVVKKMRI